MFPVVVGLTALMFFFYAKRPQAEGKLFKAGWYLLLAIACLMIYTQILNFLFVVDTTTITILTAIKAFILYYIFRHWNDPMNDFVHILRIIFLIYALIAAVILFTGDLKVPPNPYTVNEEINSSRHK